MTEALDRHTHFCMIGDLGFAVEWSKSIRPVSRYEKALPSKVNDIFQSLRHLKYQYAETI